MELVMLRIIFYKDERQSQKPANDERQQINGCPFEKIKTLPLLPSTRPLLNA
ncbi:hypothetical protein SK128_008078 [Halocaridina rubra]|uniref:Uncharacterized protein n=1 Tax=Halocaridina rubra TaxID=373956 RepID=A0AAN8XVL6_HALRR